MNKTVIFLTLFTLYILFPTSNSSLDAFAYAGYIEHNHNLFTPHHLFSNAFIYLLIKPIKFLGIPLNILSFSKFLNGAFQIINLFIFYRIASYLKIPERDKLLYVLILGFSFSLWRYGTENETYIIPISFSLMGSFYFLKYLKKPTFQWVVLSSLFGVIACLFHQIHFFWWVGILVGFYIHHKKTVTYYSIPALLVPISYLLVLVFYQNQEITATNVLHFVFHDFYQGTVMSNFGWKGLFFQLLNTFRTCFQIHPTIYFLITKNWIYLIPFVLTSLLGYRFFKFVLKKGIPLKRTTPTLKLFAGVHIAIAITNYLFAFYNYGNIEFMVLLPFLLFVYLITKYQVKTMLLQLLTAMLFIWNFSYGIFPNYYYNYYNDETLVQFIEDNPNKTFIVKNATVKNHYFYATGTPNASSIFLHHKMTPQKVAQLIERKGAVFTDVIHKPEIFNKEKMTILNNNVSLFNGYKKEKVLSYKGLYGTSKIYKIFK